MLELTCPQGELSFALNTVSKAINHTNTLPVLNNVLIEAKADGLYLAATNLEIAIKTKIPAEIKEEGGLTVPAKLLTSYIQLLDNQNVNLSSTRDLSLEIGAEHDYTKIKGIKAEEFPIIPQIEADVTAEITAANLLKALQATHFAASIHSSRPVLAGVFMQFSGKTLTLAATDSYRLAEKKVELKDECADFKVVLPVRTAIELTKILTPDAKTVVKIKLSKNQAEFEIGNVTLVSRLIEGVFPEYQKIIPQESKTTVALNTATLAQGIKKISLFAREINNNMKIAVDNDSITLSTDETKVGEGEITIPVKREGTNNQIAVNSQYLLDVLNANPGKETEIVINDKLAPLVIKNKKDTDYIYIIMPLKA